MLRAIRQAQRGGRLSYPNGMFNADTMPGMVYCSDMVINQGAKNPISDTSPTGSRVSSTGLVLSWDGHTTRDGKAKNFADSSGATDGVLGGGVAVGGAAGVRGGAATQTDAVDDTIVFPTAVVYSDHTGLTVEMSIKRSTAASYRNLFVLGQHDGTGKVWLFFDATNQLSYQFVDTGGENRTLTLFTDAGSFVNGGHLAFTIDYALDRVSLIVNGVQVFAGPHGYTPKKVASSASVTLGKTTSYAADVTYSEIKLLTTNIGNVGARQLYEDTYGWVQNIANPHCRDISDAYPLGSDRVSSTGLVLSLDMETLTADGKLKDFSGAGNHATVTGAIYKRGTIKNGSYSLDGTDDKITVAKAFGGSEFTWSTWFKSPSIAAGKPTEALVMFGDSTRGYLRIDTDGTIDFSFYESGTRIFYGTKTDWVADKWYHIAVVFGATPAIYRNGEAITLQFNAGPATPAFQNTVLGFDSYYSGNYSNITFGPTMAFNRALTPTEVADLSLDAQKMLGLVQGSPSNVFGQVGSAVDLNGTSQYVEVPDCPALNPAAISAGAWVNLDAAVWPHIMSKQASSGAAGHRIYLDAATPCTKFQARSASNDATATLGAAPDLNKWALLTGTYDGSNALAYLNGVASAPSAVSIVFANTEPLRMGYYPSPNYVDGRIAFPFILNRALTVAEVLQMYRAGLMARW